MTGTEQLFDRWPDPYEAWFRSPIGRIVLREETAAVLELVDPLPQERVLDVGCGTGLFTQLFTDAGARVTGLDVSLPMLNRARQRFTDKAFVPLAASITDLPFADAVFDKTISITAIEFVPNGDMAMAELFRITKPGGTVVVATLNRLSPWAERRTKAASTDAGSLFHHTIFRSPKELAALAPVPGKIISAVHFNKHESPDRAEHIETQGRRAGKMSGAFLAGGWIKPTE